MCRVSRLLDETAVQFICSIIHTLEKLHLKHFINTEARKLAIVHVATSFLTIQTLDRPISTFFNIILQRVIYLLAHLWLALGGIMHPPQPPPPPPPFPIPTSAPVWVFILLYEMLFIYAIYIYIYNYIYIYTF